MITTEQQQDISSGVQQKYGTNNEDEQMRNKESSYTEISRAPISEGNKHCVKNEDHQGIKQPYPTIMAIRMMKPFYINEH